MTDKNTFWNSAAKDGLVLGAISVTYFVAVFLCGKIQIEGFGATVINLFTFVLWLAKLWACLYLLRTFVRRQEESPFKYGAAVSLLSALVYSGLYFAFMTFVTPDAFEESINLVAESGMLSKNDIETMRDIAPSMPLFSFIGNLIYCTTFGTVASAIFAKPNQNPF